MSNHPVLVSRIHPDDQIEPGKRHQTSVRHVLVNLRESPLAWLHARGLLTDVQLAAGDRLRADYERAGLGPRITMQWDSPPAGRKRSGARASDGAVGRIDARDRFHRAIDAAGPGLADICWRVICAGEAMSVAERAMGWPPRSGRVVLTLALDRLAHFYGVG